jgi:DNA-binding XRE family transcriptional regulator
VRTFKREVRLNCQHVPFGQRMRTIRSILGMRQKQLASVLGINARTVIRH